MKKGGDVYALCSPEDDQAHGRSVNSSPDSKESGAIFWRCNSPWFSMILSALFGR
jgi:hypothetical protein